MEGRVEKFFFWGGGVDKFQEGLLLFRGGGYIFSVEVTFFREGLSNFWGAGLRFFRVGLGIIREAGLTFFFCRGCDFLGGVEIFSGGG